MINTIISAVTGAYIAEIPLIAACAAIVAGVLIAYFVRRKKGKTGCGGCCSGCSGCCHGKHNKSAD